MGKKAAAKKMRSVNLFIRDEVSQRQSVRIQSKKVSVKAELKQCRTGMHALPRRVCCKLVWLHEIRPEIKESLALAGKTILYLKIQRKGMEGKPIIYRVFHISFASFFPVESSLFPFIWSDARKSPTHLNGARLRWARWMHVRSGMEEKNLQLRALVTISASEASVMSTNPSWARKGRNWKKRIGEFVHIVWEKFTTFNVMKTVWRNFYISLSQRSLLTSFGRSLPRRFLFFRGVRPSPLAFFFALRARVCVCLDPTLD